MDSFHKCNCKISDEVMDQVNLISRRNKLQALPKPTRIPIISRKAPAPTILKHIRLIFGETRKQDIISTPRETYTRPRERPKYCWIVVNDVLNPLSKCPNACIFHKASRSTVIASIKHDSKYNFLMEYLNRYLEKFKKRTPLILRRPPPSPDSELARVSANAHLNTQKQFFTGFSDLVQKMESLLEEPVAEEQPTRPVVVSETNFNSQFKVLEDYLKKYNEQSVHPFIQRPPPENPVDDLARRLHNAHIDQHSFTASSELVEKMESCAIQDTEME